MQTVNHYYLFVEFPTRILAERFCPFRCIHYSLSRVQIRWMFLKCDKKYSGLMTHVMQLIVPMVLMPATAPVNEYSDELKPEIVQIMNAQHLICINWPLECRYEFYSIESTGTAVDDMPTIDSHTNCVTVNVRKLQRQSLQAVNN